MILIFTFLLIHILWSAFSPNGFFGLILSNTPNGYAHLFFIIALTWFCVFLLRQNDHYTELLLTNLRNKINEQFLQINVNANIQEHSFFGQTATIVDDQEKLAIADGIIYGLTLIRYARNPEGEYFMFMADGESMHIFKHIEHKIAKIALKEKYVSPQ